MKALSHRQVRTFYHTDAPLSETTSVAMNRHIVACTECQAYIDLVGKLETDLISPYQKPRLSASDESQLTSNLMSEIGRRSKYQRILSPIPALVWLAAAILLVLVLNWTITNLLPQPGITSPSVSSPWQLKREPLSPPIFMRPPMGEYQGPDLPAIFTWMWERALLTLLALSVLIGLVGMGFGMRSASEKAARVWLIFLLTSLFLLFFLLLVLVPWDGYGVAFWLLPPMIVTFAALIIHLWSTPGIRSRDTLVLLIPALVLLGILLAGPWWPDHIRATHLYVFLLGALLAVAWQAGEWHGWPRRIMLGILLLAVVDIAIFFTLSPYTKTTFPSWVEAIFTIGIGLWIFAGAIVAARIVFFSLSGTWSLRWFAGRWKFLPIFALIILILVSIRALIVWNGYNDLTSEEQMGVLLFTVIPIMAAITAVIPMSWRLPDWRKIAAPAFLLLVVLVLVPAAKLPVVTAAELTRQRAETIDQAILRYYGQNNRYPDSLADLSPWFLWQIPKPATQWDHNFCYQGGSQYYRLGYVSQVNPRMFRDFSMEIHASEGEPPTTSWVCDEELERALKKEAEYWER